MAFTRKEIDATAFDIETAFGKRRQNGQRRPVGFAVVQDSAHQSIPSMIRL